LARSLGRLGPKLCCGAEFVCEYEFARFLMGLGELLLLFHFVALPRAEFLVCLQIKQPASEL